MSKFAPPERRKILALLLILLLSITVRAFTANFVRAHLNDAGWFPYGIYADFDRQAQDGLDGRESFFWISDASRTDLATYPPGYPLWLALIYRLTGSRSAATVQAAQWPLDALSVFLIVGIGVTAFGWRAGLAAGAIAALWPLLALCGASPLADAPTSWLVLAGIWMLLLAAKRSALGWAVGAGVCIGFSCWLRANAMLLIVFWAIALVLLARTTSRHRFLLGASLMFAGLVVIAPIVIRNAFVFRALIPTGLGLGTNLWEGLGENERGRTEFGASSSDVELIERERAQWNAPDEARFALYYPDGINRDRERARKALNTIARDPLWYSRIVLRRMMVVMKYAGAPMGGNGSAGVNVTSRKCLPEERQRSFVGVVADGLGMFQSILRYLLIPMIIIGVYFGFRLSKPMSIILLVTVFYYWVVNSLIHTEIRYGLPMHAVLTCFAGVTIWQLYALAFSRRRFGH